MAITRRTLRLAGDLRVQVAAATDDVTRATVEAWVRAWDEIHAEMTAAVDELLAIGAGEWPTKGQIARATRAQRALRVAQDALGDLAKDARVRIVDATGEVVNLAAEAQPRIIASQYPPGSNFAALAASFDRVSATAIDAIVRRSTQQITSLTRPLSSEATASMKRALVRGVGVGDNPRAAAARMVRGLEQSFNGGLTRALVVARTEMISAHRDGAGASHAANSDVLTGWQWVAQFDRRTCPACISMHGSIHGLDEDGPQGHQQCRCARMPVTKSWRELGFPHIAEPPSALPDGRATFDAMPNTDRLAIMGKRRLDALDSGRVSWAQLAQRRATPGWRDSYVATPLRDLLGVS